MNSLKRVKQNIVFEGASGIGKTTLCNEFGHIYNIIPEVNELFERSNFSNQRWYLNKQIERFKLSNASSGDSIFDGDFFQPIWYNWIYGSGKEDSALIGILSFYEEKISNLEVSFPDLYIVFYCSLYELQKRKENDTSRRRRNFEKHLLYIKPQISYFKYLQIYTNINVEFIEYLDLKSTFKKVDSALKKIEVKEINHSKEFQKIKNWINSS